MCRAKPTYVITTLHDAVMDCIARGSTTTMSQLSYLIISGGTGANSFASAFGPSPAFVLPVSDDGGSSAEILRCFGGPSIGDIRESPRVVSSDSRIPPDQADTACEQRLEGGQGAACDIRAHGTPVPPGRERADCARALGRDSRGERRAVGGNRRRQERVHSGWVWGFH